MDTSAVLKCLNNMKREITRIEDIIKKDIEKKDEKLDKEFSLNKDEINFVMSGFGGQDLSGPKNEVNDLINKFLENFLMQKNIWHRDPKSKKAKLYNTYLLERELCFL